MNFSFNISQRPRILNWLHWLGLLEAQSQTHPDERACLCRHITGATIAVEIGTFMGLTASQLARALPEGGVLYCVDPYPSGGESIQAIAHRQLKRAGVWSRVKMVRSDSHDAIASLPSQVDFIFVDGDHSYNGLAADWQMVKKTLRPGGIAAFHDTARPPGGNEYTVQAVKFFEEIIAHDPEFEAVETVLTLNVMRRKIQ